MPTFIRLTDYRSSDDKEEAFLKSENKYKANQDDFERIPGSPIAYWVSKKISTIFADEVNMKKIAEPRIGLQTNDNNRFLRLWSEIEQNKLGLKSISISSAIASQSKWFPHNKGGEFRKWFGNNEYVVNWEDDGKEIKDYNNYLNSSRSSNIGVANIQYYFRESITWSKVSAGSFGVRYSPIGSIFDTGGPSAFPSKEFIYYIASFLSSKVAFTMLKVVAPTINFQVGDLNSLPIIFPKEEKIKQKIDILTQQNIGISKEEWDSRETSWDFTKSELLKHKQDGSLENALTAYSTYWTEQFNTLHSNEEELNRLFIDIYGLQDELTPDVKLEDITILKTEAKIVNGKLDFQNSEIIKQFISYSVGCMLGRYSLDQGGLVVANLNQAIPTDTTYEIDDDNIIPIVDESDYFSDDMTDRFTEFVRTTFGSEKLQQNIAFIEASLGKKIRAYFQKDFYIDHTKRYKKRPIYWLFSSPKGTFQTLIYMHRYTPDTLNNILNDYLRPFRIRLDTMRNEAMRVTEREDVSTKDKVDADKKIDKIDKTLDDITDYEKTLAHYAAMRIEIDLDDGVKVNYCKFKELLFEFDKKLCK